MRVEMASVLAFAKRCHALPFRVSAMLIRPSLSRVRGPFLLY